jgi:hypothetical protein
MAAERNRGGGGGESDLAQEELKMARNVQLVLAARPHDVGIDGLVDGLQQKLGARIHIQLGENVIYRLKMNRTKLPLGLEIGSERPLRSAQIFKKMDG